MCPLCAICNLDLFLTLQELLFACAKMTTIVAMQSLDQQKISLKIGSIQIDNQYSDSPHPIMLSFDNKYKGRSFFRSKEMQLGLQNGYMNYSSSDTTLDPIFYVAASKWRIRDTSLDSYEYINIWYVSFVVL